MSTKPGIPDHFSIHDVRDAAAGSPPASDGLDVRVNPDDETMVDVTIPILIAAPLDRRRPPVRDIREAMHPATFGIISHEPPFADEPAVMQSFTTDDGAKTFTLKPFPGALIEGCMGEPWTPGAPVEQVETRDIRRSFIPIADVPPDVLADIDCPESPAGAHVHVDTPHVATLPDGSRLNLPAGTVLREGEVERGPSREVIARDLLQRARVPLAETGAADVLADADAFLAGAVPPEHPVIALVRSFVGKPGDRGPVWSAFDRLQTQVDEGDWSGATAALGDLADALNTRLGQMHDALGRDTAKGSR